MYNIGLETDSFYTYFFVIGNTLTGLADLGIALVIHYILTKSSSTQGSPIRGFISLFGIIIGLCTLYRFSQVLNVFYSLPLLINIILIATCLVTSVTAYSLFKWRGYIIKWLSNLTSK